MPTFSTRALGPDTWPDFADLVERHGGVWGGCWCLEFHPDGKTRGPERRALKEARVHCGQAHAALVYDGARCVGWCQFGPPDELPRIKHRRAYEQLATPAPQWRITCFFTDRDYRGQGVSAAALAGALDLIAKAGGGRVESYPEDTAERRVSASFLYNSHLSVFEQQGFVREQRLGKHHWVVARNVAATRRR